MGVTHRANEDGTVTQFDADSGAELVTFPDPDGSFTREHIEPVAAQAAAPAPKGQNADRLWERAKELAPTTQVRPESGTVAPEAPETEFQRALKPPATAPQEAPARLPLAGTDTQGLTAPDRAQREQRMGEVVDAGARADAATNEAERQAMEARSARVQGESDRALGRYATDLELHELAKKSTLGAEEYAKQARATPIDPAQSLGGNKFFYAIMAGIGASLSNFGAALLGQKGTADTNLVDDIVADGVRQQMADRSLKVEGAQDTLNSRRQEELRLSIRANASLEKWLESRAAVEKDPEIRAAYASRAEERRAAAAEQTFKLAEGNYQTEVQHRAAPKPVAGKVPDSAYWNQATREEMADMAANGTDPKKMAAYADKRLETGADSFKSAADGALKTITKLTSGQDVPGSGPLDKLLQPLFREGDAAAVQQTSGFLTAQFGKMISGASMTDSERQMLNGLIAGRGTLDDWKRGIAMLDRYADTQLATVNNGRAGEARVFENSRKRTLQRSTLTEEQERRAALQTGKPAATPPAETAPAPGADPVRAARGKGASRALIEFFDAEDEQPAGSPL